jgi:hypothetical protein
MRDRWPRLAPQEFRGALNTDHLLDEGQTHFVAARLRTLDWPLPIDSGMLLQPGSLPALTSATVPLDVDDPLALLRAAPLLRDLHALHREDLDPLDGRCLSALRAVLGSGHRRLARISIGGYGPQQQPLNRELADAAAASHAQCAHSLPTFQASLA